MSGRAAGAEPRGVPGQRSARGVAGAGSGISQPQDLRQQRSARHQAAATPPLLAEHAGCNSRQVTEKCKVLPEEQESSAGAASLWSSRTHLPAHAAVTLLSAEAAQGLFHPLDHGKFSKAACIIFFFQAGFVPAFFISEQERKVLKIPCLDRSQSVCSWLCILPPGNQMLLQALHR